MGRRVWAILLLGLLVGCGGTSVPVDLEAEEHAVYKAVIEAKFLPGPAQIVIGDHTTAGLGADLGEALQRKADQLPGLEPATLASYRDRNAQPQLLTNRFDLTVPVVLIGEQEMKDIFQGMGDGWDEFYRRYPNSQGTMWLSRVGFNQDATQALVYVGNQSHYLAGAGHYVLLGKENGSWRILAEVMAWIS